MSDVDRSARAVIGEAVAPGFANTETGPDGQQRGYVVLTEEERAKGFVRPVRQSYIHAKCGGARVETRIARVRFGEREPHRGNTFCVSCRSHFPVGAEGDFAWANSSEKVGT